jgi:hypothetical protein
MDLENGVTAMFGSKGGSDDNQTQRVQRQDIAGGWTQIATVLDTPGHWTKSRISQDKVWTSRSDVKRKFHKLITKLRAIIEKRETQVNFLLRL